MNPFCHMELMTSDVSGAMDFYSKVFDWKMNKDDKMDYTLIDAGSPPGGGIMALPDEHVPVCWTIYVGVEDIDGTIAKVVEAGGKVHREKGDIPGVGFFAIIQDPQGGMFGLFQSLGGKE